MEKDHLAPIVIIAFWPYAIGALIIGAIGYALLIRWLEYWRNERPWIIAIKQAKNKKKVN